MKDLQLRKLYETACNGKGFEPNDGQFKVWKQTLGWIEEQDLAQAIVEWFGDNDTFPMPSNLKPLAIGNKQRRATQAAQPLDLVRWYCPDCGIYVSGFIPLDEHYPCRCQGVPKDQRTDKNAVGQIVCGALMEEIHREPSYPSPGKPTRRSHGSGNF